MTDRERIAELYKEIVSFMPITCETCYLHKPGTYTKEDCVTYNKSLCKLDKVNIDRLTEALEKLGYTLQPEPRKRRPEQPGLDGETAGWVFKSDREIPKTWVIPKWCELPKARTIISLFPEPVLTRQDTLREVGEWLDTHNLPGMRGKYIYQEDIEQLKRGEMPEQSGTK